MALKTDEEIALAVQRGETEAFGILAERYEAKISRYARKFLFGTEDIKDLVQEVFIKTFVNIKSFDPERSFSSWIYRIAHNVFINAIKKNVREKILFFDFDLLFPHPTARETADGDLKNEELRQMLDSGLNQLSAKYREALILFYFEDKNYKEIAEILEIPAATVGVRLRRGREMLKNVLFKHKKYE